MSRLKRKIHSYSYAVFNRTENTIEATLDVSKSNNMVSNLEETIVKKTIEPRMMEFMIHTQAKKNAPDYFRWSNLSWNDK